jgi:uncharacterized membrane protein (UPF0136 family)
MITQFIVLGFLSLVGLVLGFFPSWAAPSWLSTVVSAAESMTVAAADLAWLVPVRELGLALALVVASLGVALGIRVIRIVASFLTAGGGGAA